MTKLGRSLFWLIILLIVIAAVLFLTKKNEATPVVSNFTECVAAGYPVMESFPRQCKTPEGRNFTEIIDGEDFSNLITVTTPAPGVAVKSPFEVRGKARGQWFFEASFPVKLLDGNGKEIAAVPAEAEGEWMTTEFVPFKAVLTFAKPATPTGTLVLEKDNPSGLPENAASVSIPVRFEAGTVSQAACRPTGCSGQICSDQSVVSTCEYSPVYACYKTAKCERQANGSCGWTDTAGLRQCIASANQSQKANANVPSAPTDQELYPQ
jgi:hypothetical protein